jgi:hypothetical protein
MAPFKEDIGVVKRRNVERWGKLVEIYPGLLEEKLWTGVILQKKGDRIGFAPVVLNDDENGYEHKMVGCPDGESLTVLIDEVDEKARPGRAGFGSNHLIRHREVPSEGEKIFDDLGLDTNVEIVPLLRYGAIDGEGDVAEVYYLGIRPSGKSMQETEALVFLMTINDFVDRRENYVWINTGQADEV